MVIRFGIFASAALVLAGCNYQVKHGTAPGAGGDGAQKTAATIDFETVRTRVFAPYCISCHSGFNDFNKVVALVQPGSASQSELFTKLINNGGNMPLHGSALPAELNTLVHDWIEQGAAETLTGAPATAPAPAPAPSVPAPEPAPGTEPIDFATVSAKVFQPYCIQCHHHFNDYSKIMDHVTAGDPSKSEIYTRLMNNGGDMPKNGSPLPADAVALLRDWITQGAAETLGGATAPPASTQPPAAPQPAAPQPAAPQPGPAAPAQPAQPTAPAQPAPAPAIVNPTFSDLEAKVFSQKCTVCHSDKSNVAGFSLESYDGFINNARAIVKGNSAKSGIWVAVQPNSDGPGAYYMPMQPRTGTIAPVTQQESDALQAWIDAGAVRN